MANDTAETGAEKGMTRELNQAQRALKKQAREFAREVIAPTAQETDRTEQYPWDNVRALTGAASWA